MEQNCRIEAEGYRKMEKYSKCKIDISVIVTVHNAENYLRECLNSVITQTFSNIEILCMDGGSTDASPQILKKYAEKDNRIRIINDSNTSYGHKVNEGIRLEKGEYISILESDDMYQTDMLEKLTAIAKQHHPDFVNANYLEFYDVGGSGIICRSGCLKRRIMVICRKAGNILKT